MDRFSVISPTDKNILTYKFGAGVPSASTLNSASVVVQARLGVDSAPQNIVNGLPVILGTDVQVAFHNTIAGVDYIITVTTTTSDPRRTLTLTNILPCRVP